MQKSPEGQLKALRKFHLAHRRMPSLGELAETLGFSSKNAAAYAAKKWEERGVVRKDAAGKLIPGPAFFSLRMLGTVAAGFPTMADEDSRESVSLDEWLVGNREASYLLKVSGDSMIDAGIRPGDMVLLERGRAAKSGDIVVAEVDHEWTLKYFQKSRGVVTLRPANAKYREIVAVEELQVAGVVTAVIRKY